MLMLKDIDISLSFINVPSDIKTLLIKVPPENKNAHIFFVMIDQTFLHCVIIFLKEK